VEEGKGRDHEAWSRRRWLCAVLAVGVAQVLLVYVLGQHNKTVAVRPRMVPAVALAAGVELEQVLWSAPILADAALLPLPGVHGFSAEAWLEYEPARHELKDWQEEPHWLGLTDGELGLALNGHVENQWHQPMRISEKPALPLAGGELLTTNLPLPAESRLEVRGELAGRPLLQSAALPSWSHTTLVTNTVLRLLVDEDGWTFSVALLTSSGLAEADYWALYLANALRFGALPDRAMGGEGVETNRYTEGKLVFHWHTLRMPEESAPPAPSS
jgi:hypothetical protein